MRKGASFRIFSVVCLLSALLWFNVGSLRGETPSVGRDNLPQQAKSENPASEKNRERGWLEEREEKHERFEVLEWLIKQQLLGQYQQMEIREYPED